MKKTVSNEVADFAFVCPLLLSLAMMCFRFLNRVSQFNSGRGRHLFQMQLCLNTFDGNWSKGIKSNVVSERQPRCQNEKTISLKLIFGAALKASLALGSASFLWLMGMYGYEAN